MSRSFSWQSLQKETPQETPFFHNHSAYVSEAESEHSALPLSFNGIQYHAELEMPIKVEADRRFETKTKQIAKSASKAAKKIKRTPIRQENQDKQEEMNISRELFKVQNELHIVSQNNKLEYIDGQFMRTNCHLHPSYAPFPDNSQQEEVEAKNFEAVQAMSQDPEVILDDGQDQTRVEQKRRVLSLGNSFKAFYQATKIFSATVKLAKRDSLNKVYQSILNVVLKQSSKMEVEIEKEILRVMNLPQPQPHLQSLESEKAQQSCEFNKQLAMTGTQLHDDVRMPMEIHGAFVKQKHQ